MIDLSTDGFSLGLGGRASRRPVGLVLRALGLGVWLAVGLASAASPRAQGLPAAAQAYLGSWQVNDPDDGEQAVIELFEQDGLLYGRVVRSLKAGAPASGPVPCDGCQGEFAGRDLRTVSIIRGLRWMGDRFDEGVIYDPRTARRYSCTMKLEGRNRLSVRGYVGIRMLGRTQVWERVL